MPRQKGTIPCTVSYLGATQSTKPDINSRIYGKVVAILDSLAFFHSLTLTSIRSPEKQSLLLRELHSTQEVNHAAIWQILGSFLLLRSGGLP